MNRNRLRERKLSVVSMRNSLCKASGEDVMMRSFWRGIITQIPIWSFVGFSQSFLVGFHGFIYAPFVWFI